MSRPAYTQSREAEPPEDQPGLLSSPGRIIALSMSIAMVVLIFAIAIFLYAMRTPGSSASNTSSPTGLGASGGGQSASTGGIAPDFTLLNVNNDQPVQLSSLRGKPVFLNFWATWCPPCRQEMPEMKKLNAKYQGQVAIVGISMAPRDNPQLVRDFIKQNGYDWTFIHDTDYSVATKYNVMSIPSSYFIDKQGVIHSVQIGAMDENTMESYISQIR